MGEVQKWLPKPFLRARTDDAHALKFPASLVLYRSSRGGKTDQPADASLAFGVLYVGN